MARRRTNLRVLAATLAFGLLAAGCGGDPRSEEKATDEFETSIALNDDFDPNGHFSWGYTSFASTWDPIVSINGADMIFWAPVYDRLLRQDPEGKVIPMLAEEFTPAADGTSMTLKLKQGLTFSDGTPFNAEAVKFNLDRARGEGSRISSELHQVTSVDVVDEYTVQINVDGGLGSLPTGLAFRAGIVVSPAAVQSGLLQTQPVGIGPYVTTEIVPGDTANYTKSENYWDPEVQRVATMTYRLISDDQARYNALVAGELDGAQINPDQLAAAERAGIKVITRPAVNFLYIAFNTQRIPAMQDPEVRKAINMSIDREGIAQGLYSGHCTPQIQPFPIGSPGYSEKIGDGLDIFPYDPEAAKKIFEEKGVTSLQISEVGPNVTIYQKFAEVLQSNFAEVGITMSVSAVPPAQQVQEFSIDKIKDATATIFTGINDPDALPFRYLAPTALFNPGGMVYPGLLEAAAEGAAPIDPAERKAAYEKMMDIWVENPPHIVPVCTVHLAAGFNDKVSGVYQPLSGGTDLRGVAITG